jgi:organic hydroperoxide reductase OsmC/OhrA
MTQVSRYGHMLKVAVSGMRMRVTARYRVDGSVLNDTIEGRMLGAETTLEIESTDSPERVARVVRNAERGCFVMQALQRPVPVTGRTLLNGSPLAAYARS